MMVRCEVVNGLRWNPELLIFPLCAKELAKYLEAQWDKTN